MSRPKRHETQAKTERFLTLVADGKPYDQAAKESGIDPARALRLVSEKEFGETVQALGNAA